MAQNAQEKKVTELFTNLTGDPTASRDISQKLLQLTSTSVKTEEEQLKLKQELWNHTIYDEDGELDFDEEGYKKLFGEEYGTFEQFRKNCEKYGKNYTEKKTQLKVLNHL